MCPDQQNLNPTCLREKVPATSLKVTLSSSDWTCVSSHSVTVTLVVSPLVDSGGWGAGARGATEDDGNGV